MEKVEIQHLNHLNQEQEEAVRHMEGPLLVLAGAGTGKTRVLTSRIVNLISTKAAFPNEILAVTFTNKAANVMKERVSALLGESVPGMYIGTFHSISTKILRNYCHLIGLNSNFTIVDQDDQIRLVKRIVKDLDLGQEKINYKAVINQISAWKDKVIKPEQVEKSYNSSGFMDICRQIYPIYQGELKRSNSCDFGDLILHVITLLSNNEEVQNYYNRKFKFVLVDEYQDTNTAQYLWLRLLVAGKNNICCVGDDDQSIYGFRGAEVENILRFERDFPGAKIVKLQQNYRSTQYILNVASNLISHNKKRHEKTLYTAASGGNKVNVISNWDDKAEASTIADEIISLLNDKHEASEISILVRASFQTRNFEETLLSKAVPYRIIGGLKFYDRKEIKDIISYLRIIYSNTDNLALERIINTPKRGAGPATLQKLNEISRSSNLSLFDSLCSCLKNGSVKGKVGVELEALVSLIFELRNFQSTITLSELAKQIVEKTGYIQMLKADKEVNYEAKLENLQEFYIALNEFDSLEEFLEHVSLINETQSIDNGSLINIITLHSAKGLEFDTVFLAGWEDGLFPHQKTIEEGGSKGVEEERRLAYVGITRAKKNLYISYASNRRVFNQWQSNLPSRFLKEMPEKDISYFNHGGTSFQYGSKKSEGDKVNMDEFKVNQQVKHVSFGQGSIKSVIGDVVEVVFNSGETRFVTAKTLTK